MHSRLIIDGAGRVVLPKTLRDELHLAPGDTLEMDIEGEEITLRPSRETGSLIQEQGVWVFYTGIPLRESTVQETLQDVRDERHLAHFGNAG